MNIFLRNTRNKRIVILDIPLLLESKINNKTDILVFVESKKKDILKRLKKRKSLNRYDKFKMTFYNKVQNGFIKLSKKNKKKYQLIDSNLGIKENEKLILNKIDKLIK